MKMDRYQLMHYLEPVALFAGRILYDVLLFLKEVKRLQRVLLLYFL